LDKSRSVPFRRLAALTAVFSAPPAAALMVLVGLGRLDILPALLAAAATGTGIGLLFRPLLGDWGAVAAYLRPQPGRVEPEGPPPDLRFSDAAREVAVAAQGLRLRARQKIRRAEALAASRARLLDSLPEPLLMISADRLIVVANASARTLFGREIDGRPLTALLRDPAALEAVDGALTDGRRRDFQLTLSGPVERSFEGMAEPFGQDDDGADDARLIVLLHDVTSLVRAEQMRADFVANASHELRTPLTSVLGFIETLRGPARDDPDAHERFLGIMFQQASRMKRLIEDLLSLSRIELREHTPPTARVDLREVIESVAEGLQIQIRDKDMRLVLDLPEDDLCTIGDVDELTQVVQNLLTNAIKYGRPETEVTIQVRAVARGPASMPHATRHGCVVLHVRDRGEGIAKEHLPRLTERFYRVDTARSRQLGGTGLGLAIVKHIVNRHRGALTVDSVVGQGSVFSVFLPGDPSAPAAPEAPADP
jgi:two-component system phosphate regulon sensor histidine kinase PhoR